MPVSSLDGFGIWVEDQTSYGNTLSTDGVQFDKGIGGQPQDNGEYSWMLYNLDSEVSRLNLAGFPLNITGIAGKQDGSGSVDIRIKTSSDINAPSVNDWENNTGRVEERFNSSNRRNVPVNISLTNVKWIWVGMSSLSADENDHGVLGNLQIHFGSIPGREMNGLQAWYLFKEGTGTIAEDVSGNGIPLDLGLSGTDVTWIQNGGIGFSTDDHQSVLENLKPNKKFYTSSTNSDQLTIECWFRTDDLTQTGPARILEFAPPGNISARNWTMGLDKKKLHFRLRTDNTSYKTLITSSDVITYADKIYHVLMTYKPYNNSTNEGGMKIWVDGVLVGSNEEDGELNKTGSNAWDENNVFSVGNLSTSLNRSLIAKIYMVAIYDRYMNGTQVSYNFDAGIPAQSPYFKVPLGVTDVNTVLPSEIVDGPNHWQENLSANNQTIVMDGVAYSRGLGGQVETDGSATWLIYDVQDQLDKLLITDPVISLTGFAGKQDGGGIVSALIKVSNSTTKPTEAEWLNDQNGVENIFTSNNLANQSFKINMEDRKWIWLGVNSSTSVTDAYGVFGDVHLNFGPRPQQGYDKIPGLTYKYYEGTWNQLREINFHSPIKIGTVSNYSLSPKQRDEEFAFEYTGYVQINSAGNYTFYTTSDDGSELYINNQLIVKNDGLHGMEERSGTVFLDVGLHPIRVIYFQLHHGFGLNVEYKGPGISKSELSDNLLSTDVIEVEDYNEWTKSQKVYLNTSNSGANISSEIKNFPVLLRLDASNFDFDEAQNNGGDIRFADSDGRILPFEIENWDYTNKKAEIWIKTITIHANNNEQYLKMYWGNNSVTSTSDGHKVFDAINGYSGVYHLKEDGNTTSKGYKDATVNEAHGTGYLMTNTSDKNGVIGIAQDFEEGDDQRIELSKKELFDFTGSIFVSCWIKVESFNKGYQAIVAKGENAWRISRTDNYNSLHFGLDGLSTGNLNGEKNVNDGQWHYVAVTYDGGDKYLYVDGLIDKSESSTGSITKNDEPVWIGNNSEYPNRNWDGMIDELRISNKYKSPDWIKLCYENQKPDQTLVSFAQVTTPESAIGFETESQWSINSGSIELVSAPKTEGDYSLKVMGGGWQELQSISLNTSEINNETQTLSVDVYLGTNQPNIYWIGQLQLLVTCQSASLDNVYLGNMEFTPFAPDRLGKYHRMSFTLSPEVLSALQGTHSDFKFKFAFNTNSGSGPYYIDNFRFE